MIYDRETYQLKQGYPTFEPGSRLMFITHHTSRYHELEEIELVLKGGCRWVQLRMKGGLDLRVAHEAARLCRAYGATFCVNDDIHTALASSATACHLGKNDLPLDEAWRIVEKESAPSHQLQYIGATANTFDDILRATKLGASYIGLGPYRFTDTKKNLSPVLGLKGYQDLIAQRDNADLRIPVFAIGGILLEDIEALMQTGITGIAVSGAIVQAADPIQETRKFIDAINKHSK